VLLKSIEKLLKGKISNKVKGIKGIKMVNHKNKILDGGKFKFVPECIEMKKPEYVYKFEDEIKKMNSCFHEFEAKKCLWKQNAYDINNLNELNRKCEMYKDQEFLYSYLFETEVNSRVEFNKIARYYKIIPFTPSVMINISPDWNGEGIDKKGNWSKIQILKNLINSYMKEGWYDKWTYVIECGSDGSHIHAHIVAHMNPQRLKSVETHLRKGNHTNQLKKYGKKVKGMEGIIKGSSVQKVFLRTEEIVKDKMDYLIEENKPEGHKNLKVLDNCLISGEL
jgi:hypothetical protein